jgi:chemosensory pili system protein ChpA (sensor histidine kinase/response regulator)
LRAGGRSFALAVDGVHGKEQCVVKPLGGFPEGLGPFSSGTISSEGRVILVLNPSRLLETTDTAAGAHREVASGGRAAETTPGTDGRKRFLLVDDSISVRKFVGQMLENAGFDVVTASDGAVALQALETTAIHAVVTDLEMPNMNGYELIEHLRRRPSTRDLPIVILTTRGGEKHHDLARRLGVTHFLTKPVQEEAFVELMASLVASTDGRR